MQGGKPGIGRRFPCIPIPLINLRSLGRHSNRYYIRKTLTSYQRRGNIHRELWPPARFRFPFWNPSAARPRTLPLPRTLCALCLSSFSRSSVFNRSLRNSSDQCHSKDFSLPLFSCSYELICIAQNAISNCFFTFRTLCAKHPGVAYPADPQTCTPHPACRRVTSHQSPVTSFRFRGLPAGSAGAWTSAY